MTTTIAPTTETKVSGNTYFSFTCYVDLADTEKILIELSDMEYDQSKGNWVLSSTKQKYQLEQLCYTNEGNEVKFYGATIRGFRKDGALKFRSTYLPSYNKQEAIQQIPMHYHDYAIKKFNDEMNELLNDVTTTIKNGVTIK